MIIAAYAGCGKTTFAKKHPDVCVEVASMPYARILPIVKEETNRNFEQEKAAEYHVNNPIYPYNMIADILELEKRFKYVIIPSVQSAIEVLQNVYKRKVILCYPDDELEEEYRERYLKRGNTETFCVIFADGMQNFLKPLKNNKDAYHFVLKSGEFLEDKFYEFEDLCKEFPMATLEQERIAILKDWIHEKKKDIWLHINIFTANYFYQVKDVDNAEEREFIYNFAKKLYEYDYLGVIHSYDYDIRESAEKTHSDKANVVGKEELLNILETKTGTKVEEKEFSITLSGFEFKKNGKKPELFGVYLLIENDGRLSAGCWTEGLMYPQGIFHQSRGGVIELDDVIAWLDVEKLHIDIDAILKKQEGVMAKCDM